MKTLEQIIEKYKNVSFNQDNYSVGGGLVDFSKFASNRHEDAINDKGKLTLGKANQLFSKVTGLSVDSVKSVIEHAIPNMEWHHAGKLPKQYGGGMKKTYFVNANEIVDLASNWEKYVDLYSLKVSENKQKIEKERNRGEIQTQFLQSHAKKVVRTMTRPEYFYETGREMNGKYGWFDCHGKSYNMTIFYSGWEFEDEKTLNDFLSL